MTTEVKHICIIAGEPSGDVLGGRLIHALKAIEPTLKFSGVGGDHMIAEGMKSLFPMSDLSVMGLVEVLPRIPQLLRRIEQTIGHIEESAPDIVVTIDSPDFSFRVLEKLRKRGQAHSKMIHYVAPTVWAWRQERAAKVARLYDGLMCLLPFEPEYFKGTDIQVACTGHPMIESLGASESWNNEEIALGLFFGSRMGELNRMGPILRDAVLGATKKVKNLRILAPTLPHLEKQVKNLLEDFSCKTEIISDPALKKEAYGRMDAAMSVSGTAGLELAVAGVPHIIAYKVNVLTWLYIRKKIKVQYAHLANILLDREVVPEFIQERCRSEKLEMALLHLLHDNDAVNMQKKAFAEVRDMLSGSDEGTPSEQAARFCLGLLGSNI